MCIYGSRRIGRLSGLIFASANEKVMRRNAWQAVAHEHCGKSLIAAQTKIWGG